MIVRSRPSGFRLFLVFRGSVLKDIWKVLLVNIILATLVTMTHGDLFSHKVTLTAIPFTLIGLPLAIFLGFRNNAAYDRYCEGRKLWGEIVLQSRNSATAITQRMAAKYQGCKHPRLLDAPDGQRLAPVHE